MNTDIRINISFKGHRKRKKLEMLLGKGATGHLLDLWIAAATSRPSGKLVGMSEEDIALDSGWEGDPKKFVQCMLKVGFLKKSGKIFVLHDWEEHQSWVIGAPARSEKARVAAQKRWAMHQACPEHATSNAKAEGEQCPSPILTSPNLKTKKKATKLPEFPESLDSPEFLDSWTEFLQHRKEIRKPMKPLQQQKLLKRLTKFGLQWSIARIEEAISNGWIGLIHKGEKPPETIHEDDYTLSQEQIDIISKIEEEIEEEEKANGNSKANTVIF